jgi:hypothetical protein
MDHFVEEKMIIARQAVIGALDEEKMVEAEGGYAGKAFYIIIPKDAKTEEQQHIKTATRSCHETSNKHLKICGILRHQFCHRLEKHSMCFRAVRAWSSTLPKRIC